MELSVKGITEIQRDLFKFRERAPYFFNSILDSIANLYLTKLQRHTRKKNLPKSRIVSNPHNKIRFTFGGRTKKGEIGVRTGNLKESFRVFNNGRNVQIKSLSYGKFVDKGYVIRPKNSKYLAIPIDKESYGRSPREMSGLIFVQKTPDLLFAFKRRGKGYKPLYMLTKKPIKVEGREYVISALEDLKRRTILRLVVSKFKEVFNGN